EQHYCSLSDPCRIAFLAFSHFLSLRLVSSLWNEAVSKVRQESSFFRRVEDAYYPHLWHVNTKVRKFVVLRYYRTYHTISSEHGKISLLCDRGVYHAYDFSSSAGCLAVKKVVLKTWVSASDNECLTESTAYDVFRSFSMAGIPVVLANSYDAGCDVHAIVLELLGPTLDDLCRLRPGGKLEDRMVLAVLLLMPIMQLDRYKDIHARGIIHNGIKPGNICLPPPDSNQDQSTLYAIDFGLSFTPDASSPYLLPSARRADTVGNRSFLSIYGHHGITHSQRDDLESLAYLLSFLRHGSLPWDDVQSLHLQSPSRSRSRSHSTSQDTNMRPQLWRIKMATPASILFLDMDSSYVEFWRDVRSLAFGEVPDYDMMKKRFVNCWVRERYGECPGEVNW
ncbi:hypothetical protein L208DRAFT_1063358, partial [Tricholoma matsutake]